MSAKAPAVNLDALERLKVLGERIRAQRQQLGISAVVAAEQAGLSRVTLHRIERGEPSVAMGAWTSTLEALGLAFTIDAAGKATDGGAREDSIPVRVRLSQYRQLRQLAWQVHGTDELTPAEALAIYERNARHLDLDAMQPAERELLRGLRTALQRRGDV